MVYPFGIVLSWILFFSFYGIFFFVCLFLAKALFSCFINARLIAHYGVERDPKTKYAMLAKSSWKN
jgi:hypothetical protein